ncbi:Gcd10p family-domain-containing protein [Podospora aff. communis PSN243]|uniref:tRNA (adenine(58)-N(1))-methyltransferase non-catalytic subunit TRM6 n=1 Tax=Podospora aff. communis PSN243 TaxID=3040156 RepID=A0AAV9GHD4_9PEZI|nr:Gcd10p family-domain-containing protein [Podospora aff. communis PSN243]
MHSVIRPNSWAVIKLPSGVTKVLSIAPNTTISLGKYGSFPANLILGRPYHVTYEIQDKRPDENFSRLRIVPASELYEEVFAEEEAAGCSTPDPDTVVPAIDGAELTLVDAESGEVVTRSTQELIETARQTLTQDEIEELKREGNNAGKDVIAKLLESHTALSQKTSFSLAKYKLLKQKKYIRRFQILPMDPATLAHWQLEERESSKIMDMRAEMLALVGCWGNVHYGGEDVFLEDPKARSDQGTEALAEIRSELLRGRWLVVDDTGGLLVAAMAERMGILNFEDEEEDNPKAEDAPAGPQSTELTQAAEKKGDDTEMGDTAEGAPAVPEKPKAPKPRPSDFEIPFSQANTITVVHGASQPNLSFLSYWDFDAVSPNHPPHPLLNHLLTLSWLQLLKPELDTSYSTPPLTATPEVLSSWKPSRRGNFHRKRRRFARTKYIVDSTRAGGFNGLVCASTMEPISILKHALPLLSGGAPVAIYSPSLEPLAVLADLFSVSRRTAWSSGTLPELAGKTPEELENWQGSENFPLNPMLLLGTSIQTSRARRWQVLPGRTHPLMTEHGGTDGYIFTAWKAKPAEGKVAARGRFKRKADGATTEIEEAKRVKIEESPAAESETTA